MNGPRLIIFVIILGGPVLSIGIGGEGYLDEIGELKTQLDQLKIYYSPKGVTPNSFDMGQN